MELETESTKFVPFVPAEQAPREFTIKSVLVGVFFALLFAVTSCYLALRAGLTVGGSIPIAVLSIAFLKRLGKSTILENNIIQSIGSAGECISAVTVFTLTALIFLKDGTVYFRYTQIATLAMVGGLLGVLFMIPLRRTLIVKEHKTLPYPEGTACAEVLMVGEKQGNLAKPVFVGAFMGSLYWVLMKLLGLWKETPYLLRRGAQAIYANATLSINVTPEYLGIGYIIGPRSATQILVGGLFMWLAIIPLFAALPKLPLWLGAKDVPTALAALGLPSPGLNEPPTAAQLHAAYGKFIGMGAMVCAGLIILFRTLPIVRDSLKSAAQTFKEKRGLSLLRTEKEIPIQWVLVSAVAMVLLIAFLPNLPGKFPGSLLLSFLIVVFGFFFVTVSCRFVGVIGYTVEPVTPMMITTVMATCLIFLALQWTDTSHQAMVILIAAVVSIAAGNAGASSQDLKTGFLVGATPWKQQIGLLLGVIVSALVVGKIVLLIDGSMPGIPHAIGYAPPGEEPTFAAPQANLLSMLIKAVTSGKMPWGLVLIGAGLAIIAELCGAIGLSVAAGMYWPISTVLGVFAGAFVRYLAQRKGKQYAEGDLSPGMLYATGLVAGGALIGMILGLFSGFFPDQARLFDLGHQYWKHLEPWGDYFAIVLFMGLGALLYRRTRR